MNLKQLENLAKKNNWTIRVAKPQITESTWSNISAFAVDISDKKTQLPVSINDDIDLLDIKLKVADDHNYMAESSFYYQESSYQTSSGSKFTLPTFAEKFKFISKHSWFEGHFHGEAVNLDNYDLDYSKIGTKAYLVDKNGKKYPADISESGYMTITDIPATSDEYMSINPYFPTSKKPVGKTKDLTLEALKKRFN
ncbi:hypothetical protein [Bacillus sp. UMB0893]|uniref:hypothetical protein n=1 Tax=Bacillus sp. UMB0893 TaxID=2066053 RepID=UPI000C77FFAD|nr:hypothetical protein [Bacillus sp. UMB0893]PLR68604.1 hypothetical protein CYJ36_06425 [Bacillus sp. UMB0893]